MGPEDCAEATRRAAAAIRSVRDLPGFDVWRPVIALEQARLYRAGMEPEWALFAATVRVLAASGGQQGRTVRDYIGDE